MARIHWEARPIADVFVAVCMRAEEWIYAFWLAYHPPPPVCGSETSGPAVCRSGIARGKCDILRLCVHLPAHLCVLSSVRRAARWCWRAERIFHSVRIGAGCSIWASGRAGIIRCLRRLCLRKGTRICWRRWRGRVPISGAMMVRSSVRAFRCGAMPLH